MIDMAPPMRTLVHVASRKLGLRYNLWQTLAKFIILLLNHLIMRLFLVNGKLLGLVVKRGG